MDWLHESVLFDLDGRLSPCLGSYWSSRYALLVLILITETEERCLSQTF